MLTAFVAGSTGYTGQKVVSLLRLNRINTIAHIRPNSSEYENLTAQFKSLGATIDSTPWNSNAIEQTIADLKPNLIFCLLGTTKKRARIAARKGLNPKEESYEKIDYGCTSMLVDAATMVQPLPKLIYLSAKGVSSHALSSYMQTRWKTEEYIKQSQVPFIIARPCFITGHDRTENRPLERLTAAMVDSTLSGLSQLGATLLQQKYQSINAQTLATALVQYALNPQYTHAVVESELLHQPPKLKSNNAI